MMGSSGGGEFVQRFMHLHSERLLIISIGAPGRATALYEGKKWPDGIQNVEEVFGAGTRVDIKMISRVPIQLVVSSADNLVHGGEEF